MSLHCASGARAEFPPPVEPAPRERGAKWRPPDLAPDTCLVCGRLAWQHWTVKP